VNQGSDSNHTRSSVKCWGLTPVALSRPLSPGMDFSIGRVVDENTDDSLEIRWLVDWEGPSSTVGLVLDRNLPATGDIERTDPLALSFSLLLESPVLKPDGLHTVTVVVADRIMVNDQAIGFPDTAEGREGQYDTYQWTFTFAASGLCSEPRH